MTKRIFTQLELSSEEERSYYQNEAERLGYKTLSSFIRDAITEKIEKEDPILSVFMKIEKLLSDTEMWLQEVSEKTEKEEEAQRVMDHLYQILVRSDVMRKAEQNYCEVPPEMLDGEEPHKEYKFPIVRDDLAEKFYD